MQLNNVSIKTENGFSMNSNMIELTENLRELSYTLFLSVIGSQNDFCRSS